MREREAIYGRPGVSFVVTKPLNRTTLACIRRSVSLNHSTMICVDVNKNDHGQTLIEGLAMVLQKRKF